MRHGNQQERGRGQAFEWTTFGLVVALAAGGCAGGDADQIDEAQRAIFGGTPISVATRRQLGLIDVNNGDCSGAMLAPDWVLTAGHCVNFANPTATNFSSPDAGGGAQPRLGDFAVQAGSADIGLVHLQPQAIWEAWPTVTHALTTASEASFVGQSITCYGRGTSAYGPNGVGAINNGTWKSLTKTVNDLVVDAYKGDAYHVLATGTPGTNVFGWGDSGANCITSAGQTTAVLTVSLCGSWQGQGQPGDTGCTEDNVTSLAGSDLTATTHFQNYLTQAQARPIANIQPLAPFSTGWADGAFGSNRASVAVSVANGSGVVALRGGLANGATSTAFSLPFEPSARVYVPLVTADATIGRLVVDPTGATHFETESGTAFSEAQVFTSLDGVSFDWTSAGTTPLTLLSGWTTTPYGTRAPAVRVVDRFVRLQGAMQGGTTGLAFTLPVGFRPSVNVYLPIGLCNATKGRLAIATNGNVTVVAENGFANAQCFTSLEGASFALDEAAGATTVALQNGWQGAAYGTGYVRFRNDGGVVRFQGGASGGTSKVILTLPPAFRPATAVWVPADFFGGARGRLLITPDGTVSVDVPSELAKAEAFVSFDGVSFVL